MSNEFPFWNYFLTKDRTPRPFTIVPGDPKTAIIELTDGNTTVVDVADIPNLIYFTWGAICYNRHGNSIWYAKWTNPQTMRMVFMHRMIMGEPDGKVDHKNGDGLDNRRCNLRVASNSQNAMNNRKQLGRSSIYKGVWREDGIWRAQFQGGGKMVKLGRFETEIEAAKAYDKAAMAFDPHFCKLNFPVDKSTVPF